MIIKEILQNPRNSFLKANANDVEETVANQVNFLTNGFQLIGTNNNINGNGRTQMYIAFGSDASAAPALPDSFANKLYAGTGSPQSISGLGFSPSLVWLKSRNEVNKNVWTDSVRGANKQLFSDSTDAESTSTDRITSFDSDGFTLNSGGSFNRTNNSGTNYVAWNWKANSVPTINTDGTIQSVASANQAAGFSILTWTGTGAQGTIGHGLSVAPELIISKRLDSTNNWSVYDKTLGLSHTSYPNWLYLNLNSSEQNSGSSANHPYYQAPSSTLIYQNTGTSESTNVNGGTYVSYCFASISGFSSIGTYTGYMATSNRANNRFRFLHPHG